MAHPESFPPDFQPSFRPTSKRLQPKLIAKSYEFTIDQVNTILREHIGQALGLNENSIQLKYNIEEVRKDLMDRYPGTQEVTGVTITLK